MAKNRLTLPGLPLAIFRLILHLLDRKDLDSFRLVSRACRYLSEPIVFRTVALHDQTRFAEDLNEHVCDRLRSPKDDLYQHVRHLKIGPFKQEKNVPDARVLTQILTAFDNLQDFSWSAKFAVPQEILALIRTKWPDVRLHLTQIDRKRPTTPLDTKILCSTQLHSVDLTVFCKRTYDGYVSEFAALKNALLQARGLKRLTLNVNGDAPPEDYVPGPSNLQFTDGDDFPSLEYLTLPCGEYALTRDHCQRWLTAMDWRQLRCLDLYHGAPRYLFEVLTDKVPQLKTLRFGFLYNGYPTGTWDCPDLSIVQRFLDSIDGLEELSVAHDFNNEAAQIRQGMIEKHGKTLQTLHARPFIHSRYNWRLEEIRALTKHCPDLQDLWLKIALEGGNSLDYLNTEWPHQTLSELHTLRHLRNLGLDIVLHEYSTGFVYRKGKRNLSLVEDFAVQRLIELFNEWTQHTTPSGLESLRVCFAIQAYDMKEWEFTVKRKSGPGKKVEVERKFIGGDDDTAFDPFG